MSDLHMGELAKTGDAVLDGGTLHWWHALPLLEGHLGHTQIALEQLSLLYLDLQQEGPVSVVVTGDLTANGAPAQFDVARDFLDSRRQAGSSMVGLNLQGQRSTIPGNHDHWPGTRCHLGNAATCMLGRESAAFATAFPAHPWIAPPIPLISGCTLRIAGLDSDADVGHQSTKRYFARGSCASQCASLGVSLGPRVQSELRVLLLHHSYEPGFKLAMDGPSRAALAALVRTAGISIILTGHKHVHTVAANGTFHELRCGTTTQRDFFPASWHQPAGRLKRNGALVHRLYDADGRIAWETELWRRRTDHGAFENMGRLRTLTPWP